MPSPSKARLSAVYDSLSTEEKPIANFDMFQSGSVTSYVLNCPEDVDDTECGLPAFGYTVIEGPSTLQMGYSYDDMYGTTKSHDTPSITN